MERSPFARPLLLASACAVVGILAARGVFNSIFGFPWVFALVCLGLGLVSLWRDRPRRALAARAGILLAGAAAAVGGSLWQAREIERAIAERERQLQMELRGLSVPSLEGLEPLNVTLASWNRSASFSAPATIVTFWARWCSPCWKEMAELDELYREHRDDGLEVVAITRYDDPENPAKRRADRDRARRFLDNRGTGYPAAITDRDDLYRAYRVPGPPRTALVDDRGKVVAYAIGIEGVRRLMAEAVALLPAPESREPP
ncbi:MAG: TlpA disulfide reductase family protein [Thermoanaerobaculia bacterium]|nr:TlpA disulfide reductase family protein [Thermoanaerobaculia bacterium]